MAERVALDAVTKARANGQTLPASSGGAWPRSVVMDTLVNFVSGLGTRLDKGTYNQWKFTSTLSRGDVEAAYRGDWVARKIVDIPAQDATREWRNWQAEDDQITLLEKEEKRLGLQQKLEAALIRARLYGGGAIIIGTGDENVEEELVVEKIGKGGLQYIAAVSSNELGAGELELDVLSPFFGEPKYYTITSGGQSSVKLHPSRVVRLLGVEMPDTSLMVNGWGDSVLQSLNDAVMNVARVSGSLALMVDEAKTDVIHIPDLMHNMGTQQYRDKLIERFELAMTAKSLVNALLLDKEEEWNRTTTQFAGLHEILKLYLLIAAGASDIPATRLLGQSAVGLNATGEGDVRNYYDMVASDQATRLTPALNRLDEALIRSALGHRDEAIHYEWASLWQMDEAQQAEIAKKKAEVFQIDVNSGVLDIEVMRKARQNQLIEDGTYPGLEQAIEEFESLELEEDDPEVEEQFEDGKTIRDRMRRLGMKDATPRSLFVMRKVQNAADILKWAKGQGLTGLEKPADLHVTIIASRDPVDWLKMGEPLNDYREEDSTLTIREGGPRVVENLGALSATVLFFASSDLTYRHQHMRHRGASWDFDEYMPHIILTYKPQKVNLREIDPYKGKIVLGPEIFQEFID